MKKQIEEMAKDLRKIEDEYLTNCGDSCNDCPYGNCRKKFALDLYNAGYRKENDTAKDILIPLMEMEKQIDPLKNRN